VRSGEADGAGPGNGPHRHGHCTGMLVEIWSDVVCPWCYIGRRRFERALAGFEHAGEVEVVRRSFQLDPAAPPFDPARPPVDQVRMLAEKYGGGRENALGMIRRVSDLAAQEGLEFDLEHALGGSTRAAHRLLHAALAEGGPALQGDVEESVMDGYFCRREHVADPAALLRLAVRAGMDEVAAQRVLTGDEHDDAVAEDLRLAAELGITGVPFFVLDRRYGVSGAQPVETLAGALDQAWHERDTAVAPS